MTRRIIPREIVARELSVSIKALARYESLGLVRAMHDGPLEGYEPAQIRRLWSIVSYQRDMGVNLAGVEVILQLVDNFSQVRRRVDVLARQLQTALEDDDSRSVSNTNE
jgi:MerR family transcriptional regulator/heat shock protein HspR